jgi:hypothetical protein
MEDCRVLVAPRPSQPSLHCRTSLWYHRSGCLWDVAHGFDKKDPSQLSDGALRVGVSLYEVVGRKLMKVQPDQSKDGKAQTDQVTDQVVPIFNDDIL